MDLPQHGRCLCGSVTYTLEEDPVTLYACHCTDCQRQTGASSALSMLAQRSALEVRGHVEEYSIGMADGRIKQSTFCPRCCTRLSSPSSVPSLVALAPGTLDDTWLEPAGHIWTRSAQPWIRLPGTALAFAEQPSCHFPRP